MSAREPGTPVGTQEGRPRIRRRRAGPLARLDRIPVWPYERKLLWIVGAGYFFAFFDIVTISFATPVIATQFHVSKATVAYSITSSLIGYIIGAFADGLIADKWGRRLSLGISVAVFSLGTILAALSTNVTELIAFRFIAGLGIGAEIAAVTTYIGEVAPARLRGRYTSWATTMAYAGFRRGAIRRARIGSHVRLRVAHPLWDRRARRPHDPHPAARPTALSALARLSGPGRGSQGGGGER